MNRPLATDAETAVLQALAAQGEVLSAGATSGVPVIRTRLRFVDPGRQYLVVARTGDKVTDDALLAMAHVELFVEWGEWRIAFAADRPEPVSHEGMDAIRLQFPESVSINRRRMFERAPVPGSSLRCVSRSGTVPAFEAIVTDISQGGIGIQIDSAGEAFQPGMVLAGCRIERPAGEPVTVDLEVRHTAAVDRPDGHRAVRAGCRFVNLSPGTMALVAEFVGNRPGVPRSVA